MKLLWLLSEMRHLSVELQRLKGYPLQSLAVLFKIKSSRAKEGQDKILWKRENFISGMSEELP